MKSYNPQRFSISSQPHNRLGDGVYFWQDAPAHAWKWGREERDRRAGGGHGKDTVVLGALLQFSQEDCIDFLDIQCEDTIRRAARALIQQKRVTGKFPGEPEDPNEGFRLDGILINETVSLYGKAADRRIVAVRAPLWGGEPFYQDDELQLMSDLGTRSSVQIAVLDPEVGPLHVIRGIWQHDPL